MTARGSLLARAWRHSPVLTLPATLFFAVWFARTEHDYQHFKVRRQQLVTYPYADIADQHLWRMLRRAWGSAAAALPGAPVAGLDLRAVHLRVGEAALAGLDADLPDSGMQFVKAEILGAEGPMKCKVRYRGDTELHWAYPKKSWRIKLAAGTTWEGMAAFNLLAPKLPSQLNTFLGCRLASAMGLLAPRTELVNVVLNGMPMGLHVLVEQLDEGTLRRHRRMPGDLYAGELIGRDAYPGVYDSVFRHPAAWTKLSVNNHYAAEANAALAHLLRLIAPLPSEEQHAQLAAILDLEAWGRFAAFETLCQSWHYDTAHNWRLFWDSNRGRLVPVVWDPVAYHEAWALPDHFAPDIVTSELHTVLFRNGDFLRARHRAFAGFFERRLDQALLAELDTVRGPLERAVRADPLGRPTPPAEILAAIARCRELVVRTFAGARSEFLGIGGAVQLARAGPDTLAIAVTGRAPVEELVLRYDRTPPPLPALRVRYWHGEEAVEVDVGGAVLREGLDVTIRLGLLAPLRPRFALFGPEQLAEINTRRELRPGYYELVAPAGFADLREVRSVRAGRDLPVEMVAGLPRHGIDELYRAVAPAPDCMPRVLAGEVAVEGDLEVHEDVFLAAGTTVRLGPGANIRFHGRLLAEGSADAPVRFVPKAPGQAPWGAVVLQGQGCSGSRLRHCHFTGGSGWKQPLWEYSALFNVHDASDVQVADCEFRDNCVVDDMVHAVYADDLELVRCTFERSLADAVDLDICTATVRGCVFRGSGNDSLDLMTCRAVVVDTLLEGAGDKGISVGEGTDLLAIGNTFRRCNIGTQGKDGSTGCYYHCEFDGNEVAADCYWKNWRYEGGGRLTFRKTVFVHTRTSLTADARSAIRLEDCYVDFPAPANPRIVLDADCDNAMRTAARSHAPLQFPRELAVLAERGAAPFASVDPAMRGVVPAGR